MFVSPRHPVGTTGIGDPGLEPCRRLAGSCGATTSPTSTSPHQTGKSASATCRRATTTACGASTPTTTHSDRRPGASVSTTASPSSSSRRSPPPSPQPTSTVRTPTSPRPTPATRTVTRSSRSCRSSTAAGSSSTPLERLRDPVTRQAGLPGIHHRQSQPRSGTDDPRRPLASVGGESVDRPASPGGADAARRTAGCFPPPGRPARGGRSALEHHQPPALPGPRR